MSTAFKPEVATDGVVKIPSSVFKSLPPPAAKKEGVIGVVKRLDGTVEELGAMSYVKSNPNFQPRQTQWGNNVTVINKDEALIKLHLRKGIPLPPELQAKKERLDAAAAESKSGVFSRLGGGKAARPGKSSGTIKPGGPFERLAGRESGTIKPGGAFSRLAGKAIGEALGDDAPAAAAPEAKRPPRPKGGVKMMSGVEGAVRGEKRPAAAAEEEAAAKRVA
mmetsp:Transcript_21948/g.55881  ORF Transcript_21948/g.55881 Transcript_21948/m.55881 type:complete len:221 (+) Transcript_21948:81-743(+)